MSSWVKALIVLALVVPMTAYVAGSLFSSSARAPADRGPVIITREQLLDHVWGYDFDPGSNVVDVYVGYLRKKVGSEAVETVRGVGYRFKPS